MDSRTHLRTKIDRDVTTLADRVNELEDLASDVKESIRQNLSLEHQVRERPWTCMGIAVATGFVLGRLLS
jgi:ElaB/YqjD/DUF883 family membrane-anchored ribosome-binding protein